MSYEGGQDDKASKRQKVEVAAANEICVVCMMNIAELQEADCPMMLEHSCRQCNKASWNICENCEEQVLSRKCPVCRGEYAPIVLYEFPDLQPNLLSGDPPREMKLFRAKMSLLIKLLGGSNTAVYLPDKGIMRFFMPQNTTDIAGMAGDVEFLQIDIPISHDRVADGKFFFTDRVWDELENAQDAIDDEQEQILEGGDEEAAVEIVYNVIPVENLPPEYAAKVGIIFRDEEENLSFKITAICSCSGRSEMFFKYYNIRQFEVAPESDDEYEYTPCVEMLAARSWVTWPKEDWVRCDSCHKWRRLPHDSEGLLGTLPDNWICGMNTWDSKNACTEPEDPYDDAVDVIMKVDGVSLAPVIDFTVAVQVKAEISQETAAVASVTDADAAQLPATAIPGTTSLLVEPMRSAVNSTNLTDATKQIIADLKDVPGSRLFTRLSQETTGDILRIAMDTLTNESHRDRLG